ncbi:unnamed protein product [Rangifer tarandus platyrhynchus]|uniref:Uncharacterized protein n=2 Tax=Rangifer tarandus platyrhynchus TaxID=3082113 RepID=A0ACB0DW92_RANTA|nr:unnamed protein product [Rangifer tarandus platyrhynchus]CAI9692549.1 unnamed protein product [Rangifer tarandus platyrhynchus]
MPQDRVWIRQEARMLGAVQIMTGLFVHSLGLLWTYLLVSQIIAFQRVYIPVAVLSGFPFWAAGFFLLSGIFTVLFERKRSRSLMTYSIVLNILSACSAVIGLLLLCLEFLIFALAKTAAWPHGIFPIQGLDLHLLNWQVDNLPLSHQGYSHS